MSCDGHQLYDFKERGVDLEVEGMRYIEIHRGPAHTYWATSLCSDCDFEQNLSPQTTSTKTGPVNPPNCCIIIIGQNIDRLFSTPAGQSQNQKLDQAFSPNNCRAEPRSFAGQSRAKKAPLPP